MTKERSEQPQLRLSPSELKRYLDHIDPNTTPSNTIQKILDRVHLDFYLKTRKTESPLFIPFSEIAESVETQESIPYIPGILHENSIPFRVITYNLKKGVEIKERKVYFILATQKVKAVEAVNNWSPDKIDIYKNNEHGLFLKFGASLTARKGGKAAHEKGVAHKWKKGDDNARLAGKKGGSETSKDKEHMSEIGRIGGHSTSKNRDHMIEIGRKGGLTPKRS